ncbi:ABC transporter ATP-binding protein [Wansuia hejianensis]|uniref:ABC transporter ATP-binding protein n=1 Tax=Wansuia hejianensis TaxID=2763667 RepID=A0A7G9G9B6_9FIRM|nr:ABC transporter ATP-binding protein [Wansuia hejianensis]QNM07398.1 ABC transporter ATP-binding protein [Wansuia hejianensis]
MENNILSVKDLTVHYVTSDAGVCRAVNHISFDLKKGETLGLVGETGAGKTTVALSILSLLQSPPGKIISGNIEYEGKDLLKAGRAEMRKIRGKQISMVFQDPMTALNPVDCVGDQILEVLYLHQKISKKEAKIKAIEMLEMVGISGERYNEYPHQFSGGMKQRVVIAMALACSPKILLADEPTTALDVTIQAQVLDMMNDLKKNLDTSVVLITHDLGVVAQMCDRVAIMYAGEIVELGSAEQIFDQTAHPYTVGLFNSLPGYVKDSKRLKPIKGLMPDPANLPEFCKFAPRCEYKCERCEKELPELMELEEGHFVRCLHPHKKGVK